MFDGTLAAYAEDAPPTPVNFYGQTKARAEADDPRAAARGRDRALFAGAGALSDAGHKLVRRQAGRHACAAGQTVAAPTFEFRNPIDVGTLARPLVGPWLRREAAGIFHVGSSDKMSRYELAQRLAVELGASPELVRPQTEPIAGRRRAAPTIFWFASGCPS